MQDRETKGGNIPGWGNRRNKCREFGLSVACIEQVGGDINETYETRAAGQKEEPLAQTVRLEFCIYICSVSIILVYFCSGACKRGGATLLLGLVAKLGDL